MCLDKTAPHVYAEPGSRGTYVKSHMKPLCLTGHEFRQNGAFSLTPILFFCTSIFYLYEMDVRMHNIF